MKAKSLHRRMVVPLCSIAPSDRRADCQSKTHHSYNPILAIQSSFRAPIYIAVSHLESPRVSSPIILLRNLEPPKMCHGTRMVVKHLCDNSIISSGDYKGQDVPIPCIPLMATDLVCSIKAIPCQSSSCDHHQQITGTNIRSGRTPPGHVFHMVICSLL